MKEYLDCQSTFTDKKEISDLINNHDHHNHSNEVNASDLKGHSEMNDILCEFTKLYSQKLTRISESDEDLKKKVSVLESWVNDLGEQNSILVSTVEELESEASRRVTLLQEQLDKLALTTKESCVSLRDHQNQVTSLLKEKQSADENVVSLKEKVEHLENTNSSLQTENSDLRQDLGSVMQVITRNRVTGKWEYNNAGFSSITADQILASQPSSLRTLRSYHKTNSSSENQQNSLELDTQRDSITSNLSLIEDESLLLPKLKLENKNLKRLQQETNDILNQRDAHIADLQKEMTELQERLSSTQKQVDATTSTIHNLMDRERHDSLGVELKLSENIDVLGVRLSELENECFQLKHQNSLLMKPSPSIDGLKEELSNVQESLSETKSQLVQAKREKETLEQKLRQIEDKRRIFSKEKTQQTEECSWKSNKDFSDRVTSKHSICESLKIHRLENELSEKNILVRELQNLLVMSREELKIKDETLFNMEQKLDYYRRNNNEKEERMLYLASQLTNLQLEVSRLHGKTEQLKLQLDNKSELVLKLESENRSLVRQLNEKSSVHERMEKDFSQIIQDIERRKRETAEHTATIGALQEALIATQKTCNKLRDQFCFKSDYCLPSTESHPAFLHREPEHMDSLPLPLTCNDSTSRFLPVLQDLHLRATGTLSLRTDFSDVPFQSKETCNSSSPSTEQSPITFSDMYHNTDTEVRNMSQVDLNSFDGENSSKKIMSVSISPTDSLKSLELPFYKNNNNNNNNNRNNNNNNNYLNIISPSDSGIGAEDFGTSFHNRSQTKIPKRSNGTFGKIFDV